MNVHAASGQEHGYFSDATENFFQTTHDAIVTVDDQQRIVEINVTAEHMFGYKTAEVKGCSFSHFVPKRHQRTHLAHLREFAADTTAPHSDIEHECITGLRVDGQEFPLDVMISHSEIDGPTGPRHCTTLRLRDLSQAKLLQAELGTLKLRFRGIFELAPIAIWITDGDRIVFANRACASLFTTHERDTLLNKSIFDLVCPESHAAVRKQLALALSDRSSIPIVHERIALFDGGAREVEIAMVAMPDQGHTIVQMVITDTTQRSEERLELERSRLELRRLSASLVEAREEERRRIARELHDELGQRLSALKMELSSQKLAANAIPGKARINAMLEMLDETVASVRRIAADLRPLMLDDLGLNAAIEWLARESARRMGIEINVRLDEVDPSLDNQASTAVYRMVQEALTNVARHACATDVRIEMRRFAEELVLIVHDNGVGIPLSALQKEDSFGLMGIRERAYLLGGHMEVENPPDGGARITVRLPCPSSTNLT